MSCKGSKAVGAIFGLVLLLVCAGCSSSPKPARGSSVSPSGTVAGTLQLVGGPAPGTRRAASGTVYAYGSAGLAGSAVAKVDAGSDGSFRLSLRPGTYYLAATSPKFVISPAPATPPCRGAAPAVVSVSRTSHVNVECETK